MNTKTTTVITADLINAAHEKLEVRTTSSKFFSESVKDLNDVRANHGVAYATILPGPRKGVAIWLNDDLTQAWIEKDGSILYYQQCEGDDTALEVLKTAIENQIA